MRRPEPNGDPVPTPEGGSVEHRVCRCCEPTKRNPETPRSKHRFFVRDAEGALVCMAHTWESVCEARGWTDDA